MATSRKMGQPFHPADDHQGLAEVALSMARRMRQRHEHPPGLSAALPYIVLDDCYWPSNPYSSLSRSKMRLAVWRCFLTTRWSSSSIRSMTPVNGSS